MSKSEIEIKAKQIVFLLSKSGQLSLNQLCMLMNEKKLFVVLSLGFLLKEEKILINEEENDLVVEGTYSFSHMFF